MAHTAKDRLEAMRQLGEYFNVENLKEILAIKENLDGLIESMNAEAYSLPRNTCTVMCACSGACLSDEARRLLKRADELYELKIKL